MSILVLGGEGMAGWMIGNFLSRKHSVLVTTRADFDVEKSLELPTGFDYIVNCIGLLLNDSKINPAKTMYVNSYFPKYLERFYRDSDTKIIHLSTDCVFNGTKGNYLETDLPNELGVYGLSKSLGEIDNNKDLTLRVSIIGPEIRHPNKRSGLLNWILTTKETQLNGWVNAHWNGITTLELAKCIDQFIKTPIISGIYHPTNETITKYELLNKINYKYNLGKVIVKSNAEKNIDKTLRNTKGFFNVSSYDTQLEELRAYI